VICYSYLWTTEHRRGAEEGNKNRPCAIVAAHQVIEGREVVTVVPITHTRPAEIADAVEIPAALKGRPHVVLQARSSHLI
jgi:mRNA-degrading endonuclease toxin of MazEF toxin-antitoxin module